MFSLKQKMRDQKGFTIVELLIVIVVIGILAALVVTTYSGIQAKARDSKRQADVKAIQTQLEAFYASNNYYPATADINSTTWRSTNMKSLSVDSIKDPSGTVAEFVAGVPDATTKQYRYAPLNASGAACTATGPTNTDCVSYTLSSWLESPKTVYTKNNLD